MDKSIIFEGNGDYLKMAEHDDWTFEQLSFGIPSQFIPNYFVSFQKIRHWSFIAKYNLIKGLL